LLHRISKNISKNKDHRKGPYIGEFKERISTKKVFTERIGLKTVDASMYALQIEKAPPKKPKDIPISKSIESL
jgi:hypothetical protein